MGQPLKWLFATIAIVGVPILTTSCSNERSSSQAIGESTEEFADTKEYLAALKRLERAYVRFKAATEKAGASASVTSGLNVTIADLARARQVIDAQHNFEPGGSLGKPTGPGAPKLGTTEPLGPPPEKSPKERDPKDALDAALKPDGPGTGIRDLGGGPLSKGGGGIPLPENATSKDLKALIDYAANIDKTTEKLAKSKGTSDKLVSQLYENLARAMEDFAKTLREKINKAKLPTDDQDTGSYTPKHHKPSPEEKKINSPKIDNSLDDPTYEQTFGPSTIPKGKGQATDPDPSKTNFGVGGAKIIRTTGDAVTDPLDRLVSIATLRFEVLRN